MQHKNKILVLGAVVLLVALASVLLVYEWTGSPSQTRPSPGCSFPITGETRYGINGTLFTNSTANYLSLNFTVVNSEPHNLTVTGATFFVLNQTYSNGKMLNLGAHVDWTPKGGYAVIRPGCDYNFRGVTFTFGFPAGPGFNGQYLKMCATGTKLQVNYSVPAREDVVYRNFVGC